MSLHIIIGRHNPYKGSLLYQKYLKVDGPKILIDFAGTAYNLADDNTRVINFNDIEELGLQLRYPEQNLESQVLGIMGIFINFFGKEIFGPRIQDYFYHASMLLAEHNLSLCRIVDVFTMDDFRNNLLQKTKNTSILQRRKITYNAMGEREKKEMIPYFQAKFATLLTNDLGKKIFGVSGSFSLDTCTKAGKNLILDLSNKTNNPVKSLASRILMLHAGQVSINTYFLNGIHVIPHKVLEIFPDDKNYYITTDALSYLDPGIQFTLLNQAETISFFQLHHQDRDMFDYLGLETLRQEQYQVRNCQSNTISKVSHISTP